jgi:tetratricopeptide (TPR) repeat protein
MPKANKAKSARAAGEKTPERTGGAGTVLKWVGGGTAILSLIFGLRQLTVLITDERDRQRQATELIAAGKLQQAARDYRAAWTSLGKAAELRASDSRIRAAREDLAMAWLDDIRGSSGQTPFSAIVDTLVPVLSRGAAAGGGARKADLLAHLGWADFLRWRDGQRGLEPAERYRQALAVDSHNVYAHAMLGHWMLWNGGSPEDANRHFASALRSGRERPYVRHLELAALTNMTDAGELEMLRVANEMRKGDEPMDPDGRDRIWNAYYSRMVSSPAEDSIDQLFAAVPPAEHVATYRWVFENTGYVESKGALYQYLLARLQEAAGQREPALATYRSVRLKLPAGRIRGRVESAIVRLTKH